jgi:hypothetical protein
MDQGDHITQREAEQPSRVRPSTLPRRDLLATAAVAGAGLGLAHLVPAAAATHATDRGAAVTVDRASQTCQESVQDLLNLTLTAEHLTVVCYYTALTTPRLLTQIAGAPAGPAGMAGNVECLQAALRQEVSHVQLLQNLGAQSPYTRFYLPATALTQLGYTSHAGTFLWMLDHLETACIGAYMRRIARYATLQRLDLAAFSARIMGVEAEHRALYRVIAQDYPANNLTLQVAQFTCASDIQHVLHPYLTGAGLPGRTHRVVPLPTGTQITHVLSKMM